LGQTTLAGIDQCGVGALDGDGALLVEAELAKPIQPRVGTVDHDPGDSVTMS
jgi:hypothetical protein